MTAAVVAGPGWGRPKPSGFCNYRRIVGENGRQNQPDHRRPPGIQTDHRWSDPDQLLNKRSNSVFGFCCDARLCGRGADLCGWADIPNCSSQGAHPALFWLDP